MGWWRALWRNLLRHREVERELDEELQAFVAERAAELIERGVSHDAAWHRARRELGGMDQVKEGVRDGRAGELLRASLADLRLALRLMRRAPGLTAVVVLTLALGVGGATALFGVVAAVTLQPLPFPAADRLAHVWAVWSGGAGNLSFLDYAALREQAPAFEGIALYQPMGAVALTSAQPPQRLNPNFVTREYLELLGGKPALGNGLGLPDDATGHQPVAVVSHAFWQRQLGGDPAALGRRLELNGQPFTVAGVMPAGFRDLGLAESGPPVDVWLPAGTAPALLGQGPLQDSHARIHWVLARLRPGATIAQAAEQVEAIASRLARERPESHEGYGLAIQSLRERLHGPLVRPAVLLLAGAALLLAIACVNLAGTLGSRLAQRRPEIATRAALGASAGRLMRQLLVEAGLFAVLGGVAGCALAYGLVKVLGSWIAANLSALVEVRLDAPALAFAVLLTTVASGLLAIAPAFEGRRAALAATVRLGGRDGGGAAGGHAARLLVFVQVALTTVLLIGAGLMRRTVERLARRDVGYPTQDLLTFQVDLTGDRYGEPPARVELARRLEEELGRLPGVRAVSLLGPSRLAHATWIVRARPAERAAVRADDYTPLFRHSVNPRGLSRLGIPLRQGRELDARDHAGAPLAAVVSESVAREMWPAQDPIGRQLLRPDAELPPITVVGVAADVMHRHRYHLDDVAAGFPLAASGPQRDVYFPYAQRPNTTQTWALRLDGDAEAVLAGVRRVLGGLDSEVPIDGETMLEDALAAQEGAPGALALLLAAFAGFALLLAAVGVYGVVTQALQRRTRELGVRMVLGARPARVLLALVAVGALPACAGALVGLLGSLAVAPALSTLLVGVSALDPLTLGVAPGVLLVVALLTAVGPALRVLTGEPLRALRGD